MCILIVNKKNAKDVTRKAFEISAENNPHGIGVLTRTKRGVLLHKSFSADDAYSFYKDARKETRGLFDTVIHFRLATHGAVKTENVHPFYSAKNGFYFFQNGIIRSIKTPAEKCDTAHFLKSVIEKLPARFYENPELLSVIENAESGSKFVVYPKNGEAVILNEKSGHYNGGTWYSNYSYQDARGKYVSQYAANYGKRYSGAWDADGCEIDFPAVTQKGKNGFRTCNGCGAYCSPSMLASETRTGKMFCHSCTRAKVDREIKNELFAGNKKPVQNIRAEIAARYFGRNADE